MLPTLSFRYWIILDVFSMSNKWLHINSPKASFIFLSFSLLFSANKINQVTIAIRKKNKSFVYTSIWWLEMPCQSLGRFESDKSCRVSHRYLRSFDSRVRFWLWSLCRLTKKKNLKLILALHLNFKNEHTF